MKYFLFISKFLIALLTTLIIVLIIVFMTGCGAVKKAQKKQEVQTAVRRIDSLEAAAKALHRREDSLLEWVTHTNTEVQEAVPGDVVTLELDDTDLTKPGVLHESASGRTSVTARVTEKGKVKITCKADSLLRLVRRYQTDSGRMAKGYQLYDSLAKSISYHHVADTSRKTVDASRKAGCSSIKLLVVSLVAGVAIGMWLRSYLKNRGLWR